MRVLSCFLLISVTQIGGTELDDEVDDKFHPAVEFNVPVPFGHIGIEGFGDPLTDLKPPIDLLELHMVPIHSSKELKEIMEYVPQEEIQFIKYNEYKDNDISEEFKNAKLKRNKSEMSPMIPDLTNITNSNANLPPYEKSFPTRMNWEKRRQAEMISKRLDIPEQNPLARRQHEQKWGLEPDPSHVLRSFAPESFSPDMIELTKDAKRNENWSTCDDFANVGHFSPKEILYIDWEPFYIWSPQGIGTSIIHRFTHPTRKLVQKYRNAFSKHLDRKINWYAPKIQMKGWSDMLYFAVNRKGLFNGIHLGVIPENIQNKFLNVPVIKTLIKFVNPYLLLIECGSYYATAMAVAGTEPGTYKAKKAEAASIGFKGNGRPVFRDLEAEKEAEEYYKKINKVEEESPM